MNTLECVSVHLGFVDYSSTLLDIIMQYKLLTRYKKFNLDSDAYTVIIKH